VVFANASGYKAEMSIRRWFSAAAAGIALGAALMGFAYLWDATGPEADANIGAGLLWLLGLATLGTGALMLVVLIAVVIAVPHLRRGMRRRFWVFVAVMFCGVAASAALLIASLRVDCGSFESDGAALRRAKTETPRVERQRAETLVLCGHLVGATPAAVTGVLGPPDRRGTDWNPRQHSELNYHLRREEGDPESSQLSLFMEIDRGRVVYAQVDHSVTDGEPVGGGPRISP
jgi:hypothetical protein